MTYTDEHPPARNNPVAPARRSGNAAAKASRQHDQHGQPLRNFRGLLAHLATLSRVQVRFPGTNTHIPMLTEATPSHRRAFELINSPIPLTLR